mgnify:CR=1 FL=1
MLSCLTHICVKYLVQISKKQKQYAVLKTEVFFRLEYKYYPHNYRIVIENDITLFDISIFDDEQASNSLQRICKFKNHLSTECIEEAINLLKSVLLKNEFNFYFHKDGKLYKKNAEGIKRVKDIKELLNEREKRCK